MYHAYKFPMYTTLALGIALALHAQAQQPPGSSAPKQAGENPDAAFVKRNDPVQDGKEIDELVKKGYVVRTLVDGDPKIAQSNDRTNADAALATGAQWISTDYPVPDPVIGSPYVVQLAGATPARCNPISAPKTCTPADIESPDHLGSR